METGEVNEVPEETTGECRLPFCATRDDPAPDFSASAYFNGKVEKINLKDYRGSWVILFFYPSDFTFV
ncbi:AhpC/TSA family protein [Melghirimyces profundicolus]|uniref:AhpC/TSA family protein n=1 Tax=Melghirimyces profundicolus TaxID=1242148 RepID=A0A2T6BGJ3_9BACL|nr:AhpC/TSA family protein [Melghirimyces profundicolus]